jgi:arginine/lysine/ornithine decarboxylase
LIPGERFNKTIVEYLQFASMFNEKFPGFDTDIHGLVEEELDGGKRRYYVDCVRIDEPLPVSKKSEKEKAKISLNV